MKKILFLFVILLMGLTGCKERQITVHGVEDIQFDFVSGMYYVQLGGERYEADYIIADYKDHVAPEADLPVTCFTIGDSQKMQFILGRKSVEEIEAVFSPRSVHWILLGVLVVMVVAYLLAAVLYRKKIPLIDK